MAAKINWHRYGTKLHHCHPMFGLLSIDFHAMLDEEQPIWYKILFYFKTVRFTVGLAEKLTKRAVSLQLLCYKNYNSR